METTKHQMSTPLARKLIRKIKPTSDDKVSAIIKSQASAGMSSVIVPVSSKVIKSAVPAPDSVAPPSSRAHLNHQREVSISQPPEGRRQEHDVTSVIRKPAGIDKLDSHLFELVKVDDIKARATELGIPVAPERIGKNRVHALRLGPSSGEHLYLELGRLDATHSRKIISNLNHFASFRTYQEFVTRLLGRNQFDSMSIYRLDFNVDLPEVFSEFIKWIRVPYKRLNKHHSNYCRKVTGIEFGNKPVVICIYDKSEQLKETDEAVSEPITRVEIRFFGDKVPVQLVRDLPSLLGRSNDPNNPYNLIFNPFSALSIEPITLVPIERVTDRGQLIKYVKLATYLEVGGYDLAYRQLNINGNFARDFQGLITYERYAHDLNDILLDSLAEFFEKRRIRLL